MRLILASASPRRREILDLLGLEYTVCPAGSEISLPVGCRLEDGVTQIAQGKAQEVARTHPADIVIGADTVVAVERDGAGTVPGAPRDERVLGKPRDRQEAREMLRLLQGNTHRVVTAVWVCTPQGGAGFASHTLVRFYPMTEREIDDYVATGEPLDKAGAYGIQGRGLRYIREIGGDFYTVMGLPAAGLWRLLPQVLPPAVKIEDFLKK